MDRQQGSPAANPREASPESSRGVPKFDIFLSYSTDPDYKLAREIEAFLESFHQLPTPAEIELRELRICRDGSDFSLPKQTGLESQDAVAKAKQTLLKYLARSEWFLLICSANARNSRWVSQELDWFIANRPDRILLAVSEGQNPDEEPEAVFPDQTIENGLNKRLFWYDFREHRCRQARRWEKTRDYDDERTRLAADILGYPAGLVQPIWYKERRRLARRRSYIATAIAAVLAVLLVIAAWLGYREQQVRLRAEHLLRTNRARRAALISRTLAERGESTLSLLLAGEAVRSGTRANEPPLEESIAALRVATGNSGGHEWRFPGGAGNSLNSVVIAPTGQYVLTADLQGRILRWPVQDRGPSPNATIVAQMEDVASLLQNEQLSMDERANKLARSAELLAVSSEWLIAESDRRISAIQYEKKPPSPPIQLVDRSEFHGPWGNSVRMSPDERWLYVSALGTDGAWPALLVDLRDLSTNPSMTKLPNEMWTVGFTSDSKWFVTSGKDGRVRFHALTGTQTIVDRIVTPKYLRVAVSSDDIVTVDEEHALQRWRIAEDRLTKNGPAVLLELNEIDGLLASDGGAFVAVVGDRLCIVDLRQASSPIPRYVHAVANGYAKFSPTEDWFVGGASSNFGLFLLDLRPVGQKADLRLSRLPGGQNGARYSLPFSPDGRWLIAGDPNQAGRLCDLSATDPIASTYVLGGTQFDQATFSPNSDWCLLKSADTTRFWLLRDDDLLYLAGNLAGRNLTGGEWEVYFPDEPYEATFEQFDSSEQ